MKSIIIAINIFKRNIHSKYTILTALLLPLLGVVLPLLIYSNSSNLHVAVVDLDKSYISKELSEVLQVNYNVENLSTLNEAKDMLIKDKLSAIVVIPNNLQEYILKSEAMDLEIISKADTREITLLQNTISIFFNRIYKLSSLTSGSINSLMKVYNESKDNQILVKEKIIGTNTNSNLIFSAIGFIMIFNLMLVTNTFSSIIRDKKSLVSTRILLTNTSQLEYILGQILWNFALALLQFLFIIASIRLFNIELGISFMEFAMLYALITIISTSIGLLIISFCNTEEQIPIVSTLIIFPTSMLSGCLWPVEIMSERLQNLSYIFPQRYIFDFLYKLQNRSNYNILLLDMLIIVLISTVIIYFASIKLERRNMWN